MPNFCRRFKKQNAIIWPSGETGAGGLNTCISFSRGAAGGHKTLLLTPDTSISVTDHSPWLYVDTMSHVGAHQPR